METLEFKNHLKKLDDKGLRNAFKEYSQLGTVAGFGEVYMVYLADIIEEANTRTINILSNDYGY